MGGPDPPSFQGSGILYACALFTLLLITMQGLSTLVEVTCNIWRQRRYAGFRSTNLYYHLTVLLACVSVSLRCGKDAVYMMSWGELSERSLLTILTAGRYIDVLVIVPIIGWMLLYKLSSPFISVQLQQPVGRLVHLSSQRSRLWRFLTAMGLIGLIAGVIAAGKV